MPTNPVLYIFMRTDLLSLNPGKAMAQACHAANAMVKNCSDSELLEHWEGQAKGFGTTIVLDGRTIDEIQILVDSLKNYGMKDCDIIHDPTYPLLDGSAVHILPVDTCAYLFCDKNNLDKNVQSLLDKMQLHC